MVEVIQKSLINYIIIYLLKNNKPRRMSKFFANQSDQEQEVQNEIKNQNQQDNSDSDPEDSKDNKKMSKAQKKKARLARKKQLQKQKLEEPTANEASSKVETEVKEQKKEEPKPQVKQEQTKAEDGEGDKKKKDKKKKNKPLTGAALLAAKKQEEQRKFDEQNERKKRQFEEEQQRIRKQEEEKKKRQEQEKKRKQEQDKQRIKQEKKKGIYVSKKKKQENQRIRQQFERQKQAEIEAKEKEQQIEQKIAKGQTIEKTEEEKQKDKMKEQKTRKKEQASGLRDDMEFFQNQTARKFRSPICCILGHVDTGKTTLLDRIRNTNVQEGEAGGITQQIGATFFPGNKLDEELQKLSMFKRIDFDLPGLMVIDTPGHESFSNLRSRGSSLCDIAILVIDLMHGLENQTLESLELLKKTKSPFVVALNKIDRCYGWKSVKGISSRLALQNQSPQTKNDFNSKYKKVLTQLNQKGYNAALYWENEDPIDYISLIPTSGITSEGLPDLLGTIVEYSMTLEAILKKIKVKKGRFNCTVMEVKMIEGHGTTIDCILVDGTIKKEDQIVLLGFDGPIVTKVKALLTPHPMKQMRIKDQYLHHKEIFAANGVKISAPNLDSALAGTPLVVANTPDDVDDAIAICENEYENIKKKIKLENLGVGVAASTLGSLEALLEYLRTENIPVSHISVGPVSKDQIVKAMKATLSEVPEKRKQEYACLLVFDVKVRPEAQKYAEDHGIRIFTANIIYHLTDMFKKYVEEIRIKRKEEEGKDAIFPCMLKQVAQFRKSDPIVLGVDVEYGVLRVGTPICVFKDKERGDKQIRLGYVESIEHNHKKLKEARKETGSVAISVGGDSSILAGRHFELKDKLVSKLSRRSIDCLKEHYRDEMKKEDWALVVELKKYFNIS